MASPRIKKEKNSPDTSSVRLNDIAPVTDWEGYAKRMAEVLEAAMPAVHEAVRNYEAQLKSKGLATP